MYAVAIYTVQVLRKEFRLPFLHENSRSNNSISDIHTLGDDVVVQSETFLVYLSANKHVKDLEKSGLLLLNLLDVRYESFSTGVLNSAYFIRFKVLG